MTAVEESARTPPHKRPLLPLLLTLLLLLVACAFVLRWARQASGSLRRYELRVDRADGQTDSDVLILHGNGTFIYVRQHWRSGAKHESIRSFGTEGAWSRGLVQHELQPRRTWYREGMDFRALEYEDVAARESIPGRRSRTAPSIQIGPSSMTGRTDTLLLPLR